jgi:hypothetical protein
VLTGHIVNTFFPAPIGATWQYQADTDGGPEQIDVIVRASTDPMGSKVVMGFEARVLKNTRHVGHRPIIRRI